MHKATTHTKRFAFSLIEMAMVIGISGLILGFILSANQSTESSSECHTSTRQQLVTIHAAIDRFAQQNNRLPLPARRDLGIEDIKYGHEVAAGALPEAGTSTWGALPFQALGLAPSYGADCWGNKFTYVVTTALTTDTASGGYLDPAVNGAITLKSSTANSINGNTAYAAISDGEDELGGVKANGTTANWCTNGGLNSINCSATASTVADAVFNDGKNAGVNYFDDLIVYSGKSLKADGTGVCGSAACTTPVTTVPTADLCTSGTASAVGFDTPSSSYTWTCGSTPCSVPQGCAASLVWNVGGTLCAVSRGSTSPVNTHLTAMPNTLPVTNSGKTDATCTPGNLTTSASWAYSNSTCTAAGATCGTALGTCATGTATRDNGAGSCGTTRTWVCQGNTGGSTFCSGTNCKLDGVCSTTTAGTCTAGSVTTNINNYTCGQTDTWKCAGAYGGATASCSFLNCAVAGVCSTTPGYCSVSSTFMQFGTNDNNATTCGDTRTWQCPGSGGGATTDCSAIACAQAGQCGTGQFGGGQCYSGDTPFNDSGNTTCNTTRTWQCTGIYGGATSNCTLKNCAVNGTCLPPGARFFSNVGPGMDGTTSGCSTGTVGYYLGYGTPGLFNTDASWTCMGSNGGTDSVCYVSYMPACPTGFPTANCNVITESTNCHYSSSTNTCSPAP
jgi:type II secretory pathway pseudopilin PulG